MARVVTRPLGEIGSLAVLAGDAQNDEEASKAFVEVPKARGSERELQRALKILGAPKDQTEGVKQSLNTAAAVLLQNSTDRSPRLREERDRLRAIEEHARELARSLSSLSGPVSAILDRRVPSSAFGGRNVCWVVSEFSDLSKAAALAQEDLDARFGKDLGAPRRTINLLAYGDYTIHFMRTLISLYAKINGREKVTATAPARREKGCYAFIDASHKYATGNRIGRANAYKALVSAFRKERRAKFEIKVGTRGNIPKIKTEFRKDLGKEVLHPPVFSFANLSGAKDDVRTVLRSKGGRKLSK